MNILSTFPATFAVAIHYYYPGFIDLHDNSKYFFIHENKPSLVHFIKTTRPLEILDFNNSIIERKVGNKVYADIKRPIRRIDAKSTYATGRSYDGSTSPLIAIENKRSGRVFGRSIYSELCVYVEFIEQNDQHNSLYHWKALTKFLELYKFLKADDRVVHPDHLLEEFPNTRRCTIHYSPAWRQKNLPGRLIDIDVGANDFNLEDISWGKYSDSFHCSESRDSTVQCAESLAFYLNNGFELSDSIRSLQRVVDKLLKVKDFRMIIVELFALFEISFYSSFDRHSDHLKQEDVDGFRSAKGSISTKKLINTFIPILMDIFDVNKELIRFNLDKARDMRNNVVHNGYVPSSEDVNFMFTAIQTYLHVVDIDEKFRSNNKLKSKRQGQHSV